MKDTLRYVAFVVGGGALVISAFADQLGIGASPGFGVRQSLGVLLGIVVLAATAWLSSRNR